MGHLGDFGTARDGNDATFGWFGTAVRVHPDLTDLALIDLVQQLTSVGDDNGEEAVSAVSGIATMLVHPDDFDAFWTTARTNRQTMEDVVQLAAHLIGGLAGRPTRLPSASSDGQQPTDPSSTDDSSSEALRLLDGRPDLQVAVLRAREAG